MWMFEHTETTSASPAQLWAHYAEPATWPEWDHETAAVTVEGPLAVGTRGTLKPVKGPATPFTFTHSVTINGPLSPLFARVIGKKVAAGLPTAMRQLARLAETGVDPTANAAR